MTNAEKYKTAHERAEAFNRFCKSFTNCNGCKLACKGAFDSFRYFAWLDLEAEAEKPLPCPFCGGEVVHEPYNLGEVCQCKCGYRSPQMKTWSEAIFAHNRVAKKCIEVLDKKEVKK